MRHTTMGWRWLAAALAAGWIGLAGGVAWAHCDTLQGPVVIEAKAALAKGEVTPLLKWIPPAAEAELKAAFTRAVAVRRLGPEAQHLADHYFLETLVRLHRAGEGAPYDGLKDLPVEPVVALAEQALTAGRADELAAKLSAHLAAEVKAKLAAVVEAAKHRDDSVAAGRRYVAAYVTYMHYVEGVHAAIVTAGGHAHAPASAPAASHHDHE
jgi:hypothetical protein